MQCENQGLINSKELKLEKSEIIDGSEQPRKNKNSYTLYPDTLFFFFCNFSRKTPINYPKIANKNVVKKKITIRIRGVLIHGKEKKNKRDYEGSQLKR
jgi:hypothetical protein